MCVFVCVCVCVCVYIYIYVCVLYFVQPLYIYSFPGGSDGKESVCNAVEPGSIPWLGRSSGEGNGNPLQVFLPEEFHGQRSLAAYSPWGCKESDTTE